MLTREATAERINAVINHPEVHPGLSLPGQGYIDVTPVVQDRNNVILMGDGGGFIFHCLEPCVYEVHTQFVPEARGRNSVKAAQEALHWMFTRTDCMEVLTKIPSDHVGALRMGAMVGFVTEYRRDGAWAREGGAVAMDYMAIRYPDWVRSAPGLVERGKWFHRRSDEERARIGRPDANHPVDEAHDRYVGAAVEMIYGGQPIKAVVLYNRWARFVGYGGIRLLSTDPLLIGTEDVVLKVGADDFEVI